ncbi:MAG: DUF262 domain-containing HNH endonuclease family protein [Bifidobacterium tibiigranuli]|jgi:hypothetical protein|nr:DUF262 domain-containing HNH endonuclease family protein [Bifidobacterium tibiigranuli]
MTTQNEPRQYTIRELFTSKFHFSIPLYQRAYAWGPNEINTLIDDIINADDHEIDRYSLGSLVVHRMTDSDSSEDHLEVVDGQQRLTTLYLLICGLRRITGTARRNESGELLTSRSLSFSNRPSSNLALIRILDDARSVTENSASPAATDLSIEDFGNGSDTLFSGYVAILNHLTACAEGAANNLEDFSQRLLDHTQILLMPLPERTDLNHYFEIMNTRGVQLEPHEIAKARLMSGLTGGDDSGARDRNVFSKIWDACSNMGGYVQMGFNPAQRTILFGDDWSHPTFTDFNSLRDALCPENVTSEQTSADTTLNELLGSTVMIDNSKSTSSSNNGGASEDDESRFTSILDFPNFLVQSLKLFLSANEDDESASRGYITNHSVEISPAQTVRTADDIVLNDANLLRYFETQWRFFSSEKWIKSFAVFLLNTRFVFDAFIIKSDIENDRSSDHSHWSLRRLRKTGGRNDAGDTIDITQTFSNITTTDGVSNGDDYNGDGNVGADITAVEKSTHSFQNNITMLESMNQVTFTSMTSKTFVQDYLWSLYQINSDPSELIEKRYTIAKEFRTDLWNLALDRFRESARGWENDLKQAYGSPCFGIFTFNFIDYVLWRYREAPNSSTDDSMRDGPDPNSVPLIAAVNQVWQQMGSDANADLSKFRSFTFRYRNSVEHLFPQDLVRRDAEGKLEVDKSHLNMLGNLCLLTRSENSKRSNLNPKDKVGLFNIDDQSLKFRIMAAITKGSGWDNDAISTHTENLSKVISALIKEPQELYAVTLGETLD